MSKYGLQLRGSSSAKPAVRAPVASFFQADDDEDSAERELARESIKSRSIQQGEELRKKALEEIPNVFDYDSFYDESKQNRGRFGQRQREEKKESKYIPALLRAQKKRDMEHDIVYEKNLLKERAAEDEIYKHKEKFVTRGYKEKLSEREKWEAEERLREAKERAEDVTKRNDLGDFYRNLYNAVSHDDRGQADNSTFPAAAPSPSKGNRDEENLSAAHVPAAGHPAADVPRPDKAKDKPIESQQPDADQKQEQEQEKAKASETKKGDVEKAEVSLKERGDSARERYLARKKQKVG